MLSLHRTRRLLVKQRTQTTNSLRGQCAEFGVVAPQNRAGIAYLIAVVKDPVDPRLPAVAREALLVLVAMLDGATARPEGAGVASHLVGEPAPSSYPRGRPAHRDGPDGRLRRRAVVRGSRPSSGWCRARPAPAGACSSGGSRSAATPTCRPTWCMEPERRCSGRCAGTYPGHRSSRRGSRPSPSTRSPWPWPTETRGSPGRWCVGTHPTNAGRRPPRPPEPRPGRHVPRTLQETA